MSDAGLRAIATLHSAATVASAAGKIVAGCCRVSCRTARCMARPVKSSAVGLRSRGACPVGCPRPFRRSHLTRVPLSLQNIFLQQDELHSGKPIPVGALRFPGLPWWGLRRPFALSMESICIDGVHGDEILRYHLSSSQGEFVILLLIAGTRMAAHSDPVSRIVIDEQAGDLVDLLFAGSVKELPACLKGDWFNTQCADLTQTLPRVIVQGFEVQRTASLPPHHRRRALEKLFQ